MDVAWAYRNPAAPQVARRIDGQAEDAAAARVRRRVFFRAACTPDDAPCKEVILRENFSVLDFPVLQCWPLDGGRFITLPLCDQPPRSQKRQAQCRHVPHASLRWTNHRHALAAAESRGRTPERAPARSSGYRCLRGCGGPHVCVSWRKTAGGTTSMPSLAVAQEKGRAASKWQSRSALTRLPPSPPLCLPPPEVEEFLIAGFLRQKSVELVKCETVDLEVPAKR